MTDPFDSEHAVLSVLVNDEGQYSLWPAATSAPPGWTAVLPSADRATALAYVKEHWTDLRPRSLVRRTRDAEEAGRSGRAEAGTSGRGEAGTSGRAEAAAGSAETFADMAVDHVAFYVADLAKATEWLTGGYGLTVYARSDGGTGGSAGARSAALGSRDIRLLLSQPLAAAHPGAEYVERHGDGVADIALRVPDAGAAFAEAVRRGARPVAEPADHGGLVTATIGGVGDITHTFVHRPAGADDHALARLVPAETAETAETAATGPDCGLGAIDHFAVCVEPGAMDATVDFYRTALDFELIFTERIEVDAQTMITKVVQSRSGAVTFTLIAPDPNKATGHLDEFLKSHDGPGVQHIAFTADDAVRSVDALASRGVDFLPTPAAYYRILPERLTPLRHSTAELERLNILIDEDHDGQLFQIFTRSVHPKGTLFLEIIERMGARSFGSGNIKALYQAVEYEQGRGTGSGR
ncbi:4-hydroxyphenylpyruvate dioxygenase [Streptomyces sp. NPDC046985]|uniref:4-hydroxyphenylpyruvate dioxygenase n=1 Tax=Streptomyces sp. NPDC046985 TaxID=3155377 RepID=UPI0033E85652